MAEVAQRNRAAIAVLVALSLVASLFGVAVLTARSAQATPVYLEPADAVGADPFVPSLLDPADDTVPEMAGTGDQGTCDPGTLSDYLMTHPEAAQAWVAALNADPTLQWSGGTTVAVEQIPDYIAELTPALLGDDMQVTNHRFVDGRVAAVQSVLQAGTAVLVDETGAPRVRCACGNPLTPAVYVEEDEWEPEYVGEPWQGFTHDDYADSEDDEEPAPVAREKHGDEHGKDEGKGKDEDKHKPRKKCARGEHRDGEGRCRAPLTFCTAETVATDRAAHERDRCPRPPHCRDEQRTDDGRCTLRPNEPRCTVEGVVAGTAVPCPQDGDRPRPSTEGGPAERPGGPTPEASSTPSPTVLDPVLDPVLETVTSAEPLPDAGQLPAAPPAAGPAPSATPPTATEGGPESPAPAPAPAVSPPSSPAPQPAPQSVPTTTAAAKSSAPALLPQITKALPRPVRCPDGTLMPLRGCPIPETGVPVGWVQKGTRMVPAPTS